MLGGGVIPVGQPARNVGYATRLAGAVGISSVAAAIVLAGGGEADLAIGMWIVIAARAAAAIPHVRVQIARALGRPAQLWHSDVAQGLAVIVTAVAWISDLVPFAPVVVMAVIAVFNVAAVRRAPRPAKVLGFQQMAFGFSLVAVTAAAVALA